MTHYPEKILVPMEAAIRRIDVSAIEPTRGDQWLLASALQKAIRRGEEETALRVAYALWQIDRPRFYRRLHITALEDCGLADTDALIKTLTATAHPYWRKRVGDARVGLYLVRLLCRSVKTRMADALFIQAERSPAYAILRQELAKASDDDLMDMIEDEAAPLTEQALALWFLGGTKKYPSDHLPLRVGDPDRVIEVLSSMKVPPDLTHACIGVITRTPWPLSIMAPLIWQYLKSQRTQAIIREEKIAPARQIEGIPLYAMDMFTRSGQASYRQWQKAVPSLKRFSIRQIGLGLFYTEGHRLNRTMTSTAIDAFMQAGEWADVEAHGLCLPEYLGLRDCIAEHAPLLEEIRHNILRRHLDEVMAWTA